MSGYACYPAAACRLPGTLSLALGAQLSPSLTAHISRFGLYATDVLRLRPDDFDPDLPEIDFTTLAEAA
ncbi:hypothetical protein ACBJ59_04745 [Nonomuraea sp. MTCD27]|uniref:hypothetical protein n=1 Tax=Nonomuraea sp. MTCD27 TaxID=1676747 RepID=UPI0035BFA070